MSILKCIVAARQSLLVCNSSVGVVGRSGLKLRRCFSQCQETNQSGRIDEWFQSIIKSESFYDVNASAAPIRRYFYNVDLQGRLFLETTLPKNIATSIKDDKFLNFFFSRVRHLRPKEKEVLNDFGVADDYPFVSPCGKELNFIRPASTPIVFHSLINEGTTLVYGGTMTQPFDSSLLAISQKTGQIYHKLVSNSCTSNVENSVTTKIRQTPLHDTNTPEYGLIRSPVAVSLSESILVGGSNDDKLVYRTPSGLRPIEWLPSSAEPKGWALPYRGDFA